MPQIDSAKVGRHDEVQTVGRESGQQEHRRFLRQVHHTASQDFDKALMTLAAGGLGLSLGFAKDAVVAPAGESLPWIHWGWACLTASLMLILLSFLASQQAILGEIKNIDQEVPTNKARVASRWGTVTSTCNLMSTALLLAGLGCLVRFAVLNYGR